MNLHRLLTCLAVAAMSLPAAPLKAQTHSAPGVVYVIPIKGQIEPALLYVIRRGVKEADAAHAKAVIFTMDTPGGTLDAASQIVRTIQRVKAPTYTFVEKDAFSAGAIIALATRNIYMAPGSVIGDALPIMLSPLGGPQEMPEALEEKAVSAVSALIRSAAQESGHNPQLAEKMVRRDMEFRIDDEVICPTGRLLTLTNVEAERRIGTNATPLLSQGTVKDLPALLDLIGLGGDTVRELQVTNLERFARWIAALAPLFLIAGLLGIYIEIKTPGFGWPGILGGICLAVFFWGHHIAGLAGMEDMLIFMVGVALLLVEIFLIPGFGIVGVLGVLLMFWALLNAMVDRYPGGPWLPTFSQFQFPLLKLTGSLVVTFFAALFLGRYLPATPLFRRLVLEKAASAETGFQAGRNDASLIGLTGQALSFLRPAGTARFGERKLDVVTQGEYIPAGRTVRIVETHGSRIIVEPVESPEARS